jgi:phosphoglycerol transferase
MKIAIHNAFPNLAFSAEREFISRCIFVLSALGHDVRAVAHSDEVYDFGPDFIIITHEYVPKLTDHYTVGLMWSPTVFSKNEPERHKAIRSWDLAVPINATTRTFAQDIRFPAFLGPEVSDIDFYPSCQEFDVKPPDPGRLSLAYVGVHWDGYRHDGLIRALADKADLHVYGPPKVWEHLPDNYRGVIPFDGKSLVQTLNRHGAVLAIHKEEHRAEGTPSMRVFEACAARCLLITEPLKPIVDIFGDSPVYLDLGKSPEETAVEIAKILQKYREHPDEFRRRVEATHVAFQRKASLEVLLPKLIDDVVTRMAARRAPYVARSGDATISVIIRCGSRPLSMVRRAAESVIRQTYRDFGIVFVRFAPIDGFDDFLEELRSSARLRFVRVVEARGEGARSAAMWAGFRSIETPFFALLDDDDELFETHFSDLVQILERHDEIDVVYSGVIQREEDDLHYVERDDGVALSYDHVRVQLNHPRFKGDIADKIPERRALCFFDDFELDRILRYDNFIQSNTWVARRSVLTSEVLEDPNLEVAEDFYFLLLLASRRKFAFSGTVSAVWNWRSAALDNSMRSVSTQRWQANVERMERRLAHIEFSGGYAGRAVLRTGRTPAVPPPLDPPAAGPVEVPEPPASAEREAVASAVPELPASIVPVPAPVATPAQPSWTAGLGPAAVVISLLASLILVFSSISLSESIGRLTQPPGYDDVSYMQESFNLYQLLLHSGPFGVLWELARAHAPMQDLLGIAGYWLFGVADRSVYLMNGVLPVAFTGVVLWLTRTLRPLVRIVLTATMLSTPFMVNLVTEFRPDLYWGLLCGIAVRLIMDRKFLAGNLVRDGATALAVSMALLAKPSASPATAGLLAVTAVAALACRWREVTIACGSRRELLRAFVKFAGLALILIVPYFALNASHIYHYILNTFFVEGEYYKPTESNWSLFIFYSFGTTYRLGLYHTLWLGLFFLTVTSYLLWRRRAVDQALRLFIFAGAVSVAYLIPTASPVKTYYLGGMFYGTFLLFTLTVLTLFFELLEDTIRARGYRAVLVKYAALVMLLLVALTSVDRFSLVSQFDPAASADLRVVSARIVAAISSAAENKHRQVHVYVPSPFPITSHYVQLAEAMKQIDTIAVPGYFVSSLPEQEANVNKADFIVLSDHSGEYYPGGKLTPQLLNYVREGSGFRQITVFTHSDGKATYLFERVGDASR